MRALKVLTTKGTDRFKAGSGWEYEIRDGRLYVQLASGRRVKYAAGYWLRVEEVPV